MADIARTPGEEPATHLQSDHRASITVTPAMGPPARTHYVLKRRGMAYRVTCNSVINGVSTKVFCNVSAQEVDHQFDLLRQATVCAYPVSPLVCDGEYVKVTIHGLYADLILGWWTAAPEGADAVWDFADWMRELINPERDKESSVDEC